MSLSEVGKDVNLANGVDVYYNEGEYSLMDLLSSQGGHYGHKRLGRSGDGLRDGRGGL